MSLSLAERENLERLVRSLAPYDRFAISAQVFLEAPGVRTKGENVRHLGIHPRTEKR
jgi:hypothetical protein